MTIANLTRGAVLAALITVPATAMANSGNMATLGVTSQPIGHYRFCKQYPQECNQRSRKSDPMTLTRKAWKQLIDINYSVNRAIKPLTDLEIHGVEEVWSYPEHVGDCEDYVLLKRSLLMQAGFSPADLLITVVRQPDGSGHAVLTVRTDLGDYILDNMRDKVLLWSDTEYTFLKRQSSRHSGKWTKLKPGRPATVVGSID